MKKLALAVAVASLVGGAHAADFNVTLSVVDGAFVSHAPADVALGQKVAGYVGTVTGATDICAASTQAAKQYNISFSSANGFNLVGASFSSEVIPYALSLKPAGSSAFTALTGGAVLSALTAQQVADPTIGCTSVGVASLQVEATMDGTELAQSYDDVLTATFSPI